MWSLYTAGSKLLRKKDQPALPAAPAGPLDRPAEAQITPAAHPPFTPALYGDSIQPAPDGSQPTPPHPHPLATAFAAVDPPPPHGAGGQAGGFGAGAQAVSQEELDFYYDGGGRTEVQVVNREKSSGEENKLSGRRGEGDQ
jgi:hypothetical protein